MKATYKNYDELPIIMNADDIAKLVGISKANAYEIMHTKGFPTIKHGKRMVVMREDLFEWLDAQKQK